jgi:hypothetical protein
MGRHLQGGGMEGAGDAQPRSRAALRELLVEEYEGTGLHRKLSPLDIQVGSTYLCNTKLVLCLLLCCNTSYN